MSVIGSDIYATTLQALQASLSSYISKSEREQCDRYIQDLKQREECMTIMSRILSEDESISNQYVKQLALSVLNDWIKLWWNKLPDQRKGDVKQLAMDLLSSNLSIHENSSIRTKIAVIMSNVAERIFPQYWPTFMQEMVALWLSSPFSRQDVILKLLETVIVDSIDTDFNSILPTLRRQEIVAGIVDAQTLLFDTSYQFMGYSFQEYNRLIAANDRGSAKAVSEALLSLLAMLSALTAVVKLDDFCAAPHNFALLLIEMCNTPHIQIRAMELLLVMVNLHMSVELFSVLFYALSQYNVHIMPTDYEEKLQFQRTYASVLHNLLSMNIQYILHSESTYYSSTPDAVRTVSVYIEKMLSVVEQSPSIRLSGDVIKDWVKVYREKNVQLCSSFQSVAMSVLHLFMQKCRKPLWTEYPTNTQHGVSCTGNKTPLRSAQYEETFSLEFEDTEEWSTDYYGTFKSQFRLLSQTISEKFPVLAAQTLSQYLGSLVQTECNSAGMSSVCIEFKTLLLDLDMLHYVYSPLLQTLLVPAEGSAVKKTSNEGGKEDTPGITEADRQTVLQITVAALSSILQWTPHTEAMQQEQHKVLQYHYPILKLSAEHLGAAFSLLFTALHSSISSTSPSCTTPSATGAAAMATSAPVHAGSVVPEHAVKVSGCIASLTQHCAAEIVKTGFFQEFFQQVGGVLTQVQVVAVQNNMRQALMALSDHIADPELRLKTLSLAVEDVLQKWTSECATLFVSSDALLEALIAQVAPGSPQDHRFEGMKRSIDTFLLATKRITNPSIPLAVWSEGKAIPYNEYLALFPFAPAWLTCLPVAFQGIGVMHSIYSLQTRQSYENILSGAEGVQLPQNQIELLTAICLPDVTDIGKFAGMRLSPTSAATALTPRYSYELKELRIFLYQLLAQAATHKALYYCQGFPEFMTELAAHLPFMENAHLVLLFRNFLEQYVLNAMPMFYDQVSTFLAAFMSTTLQRLSTAWDRSATLPSTAEAAFCWRVYRQCSIPEGFTGLAAALPLVDADQEDFTGFSREELENARDHLIGEVTKSYCDLLAGFLGLRGFLFTPYAAAATAAAAEYMQLAGKGSSGSDRGAPGGNKKNIISGKGKDKTVRKKVSFDNSDTEINTFSTPKEALTDEQQVELSKHARRQALFQLLHTSYIHVTKPYLSSLVTLICLPDGGACKFAVQMAQKLLDLAITDSRFIVPVAKDAYTAALSVLLQQEKWSFGLEWELIEYVLDVYLMLVVGEGRHPVNVSSGSGSGGSSAGTALVPVNHHTARSEWPQQILLSLPGVTRAKLSEFDVNLQKMLSKKKRRGLMKDLITDIIAAHNPAAAGGSSTDGSNSTGSVFSTAVPSVLDVRHRLMKSNNSSKKQQQAANTSTEFDLTGLFDTGA